MKTNNVIRNILFTGLCVFYCMAACCQVSTEPAGKSIASIKRFLVSEQFIPLQNGIRLNAMVVRCEGDTMPAPALLVASCYPQSYNDASYVKLGLRKGFAGVIVYSRGKGRSGGVFEPFEHEAEDMYAIIDWVSRQPWCNGKVGMFGGSYLGFAQWAACKKLHPALKTIVPQVAAAPGIDYPVLNGVFMSYMLRWINYTTNSNFNDTRNFGNTRYWDTVYDRYYKNGLAFNRLDSIDNKPSPVFQRWLQHPDYDNYWANMIPSVPAEYAAINIPILTITGYFDDDQLGAFYYYKMHNKYGNRQTVNNHYLLIGPWDHGGAQAFPRKKIGAYQVDSLALIPVIEVVMDWFEYVLQGKAKPAVLKDRVNYFVMGGAWKHANSLEKMNKDTLRFYLKNSPVSSFHLLSGNSGKGSRPLDLNYKLNDTTENNGFSGEDFSPLDDGYVKNHNQLIFQTKPLQRDVELNGSPVADLFVSINKKDIDFNLDFYEVTADGKSFMLSTFIQRASYYHNQSKRQLITPGEINQYHFINSFFTSKLIKKGSVIRLVIKPLDNKSWQKNYGTGKNVSEETIADAYLLSIRLFMDKKYNSSIGLPCNILN